MNDAIDRGIERLTELDNCEGRKCLDTIGIIAQVLQAMKEPCSHVRGAIGSCVKCGDRNNDLCNKIWEQTAEFASKTMKKAYKDACLESERKKGDVCLSCIKECKGNRVYDECNNKVL